MAESPGTGDIVDPICVPAEMLRSLYERAVESYDLRDMGWCIDRHGKADGCVEPIKELGEVAAMLGLEPEKDLAFALLAVSLVESDDADDRSENALSDAAEKAGLYA